MKSFKHTVLLHGFIVVLTLELTIMNKNDSKNLHLKKRKKKQFLI